MRLLRQIHEGRRFDVFEVQMDDRRLALKVPARPIGPGYEHAGAVFHATRILGGVSTVWNVMAYAGSRGPTWHNHDREKDPTAIAEAFLEDEARRLRAVGPHWNHTALDLIRCDMSPCEGLLGLIMPWQTGNPLAALPRATQRRLLPRMMLSLWDALSAGLHGDLHGDNVLVSPTEDRFALIDPGAILLHHGGEDGASSGSDHLTFVTNADTYPVLPPYSQTPPLRQGSLLTHWESFLRSLTLFDFAPPFKAGEHTIGVAVSRWSGRFLIDVPAPRGEPHPADLLAVGVLYYRALTGAHPFYDDAFTKPAWTGVACVDNHITGDEGATHRLARGALRPSALDPTVHPAEDALALALVHLNVPVRARLLELSAAAAAAAP